MRVDGLLVDSLHAMRISVALHTASATEILEITRFDVACPTWHRENLCERVSAQSEAAC